MQLQIKQISTRNYSICGGDLFLNVVSKKKLLFKVLDRNENIYLQAKTGDKDNSVIVRNGIGDIVVELLNEGLSGNFIYKSERYHLPNAFKPNIKKLGLAFSRYRLLFDYNPLVNALMEKHIPLCISLLVYIKLKRRYIDD